MPLAAGTCLGPYEIMAPLGAGGMGEVYKARDTRLDRTVAVKISAARFSERFEREARAVAALNDPHICTLHDVGPNYLVMEYIEGEPLKGPLPVEQALRLAVQIAGALDTAHRKGIVHRDLKPGNILVTKSGVKLLDFGLATVEQAKVVSVTSDTVTRAITQEGTMIGTLQYMSPEQLQGMQTDHRADIFAFGCVLYEMLTGKRAFDGSNAASVIAAIMERGAPSAAGVAPASLDRALQRCLAKDPDERWQTARDLKAELKWIEQAPSETARRQAKTPWVWMLATGLSLGIAAAVAAWSWSQREPAAQLEVMRFHIEPPPGTSFQNIISAASVSPDGRLLVFGAASRDKALSLWLRPVDSLEARELPGTQDGDFPFWSPDSKSLGFFADSKLKRIEVVGGTAQTLCETGARVGGGSWNPSGIILFSAGGVLYRVSASGGPPERVTELDAARRETAHRLPQFLPDGRRFVYLTRSGDPATRGIFAGSLDDPKQRLRIVGSQAKAVYVPPHAGLSAYLLWLRGTTLVAQKFDETRLRVDGEAVRIAEDIPFVPGPATGQAAYWVSDNGLLMHHTRVTLRLQMSWVGRDGKKLQVIGTEDDYMNPRLSPDGRQVVVRRNVSGNMDIWSYDFDRNVMTRLTFDSGGDSFPVWSPDGKRVAFSSARSGAMQLYRTDSSGQGQEERLTDGGNNREALDWSRDGRYLLYREFSTHTGHDLMVLPQDGDGKPIPVVRTLFNEFHGQFSPDGKWIAYVSDESGRSELYLQSFLGSGPKRQLSNGGAFHPRWRGDGKELFYVSGGGAMTTVAVKTGLQGVEIGPAHSLFPVDMGFSLRGGGNYRYDVSADGQRFLMLEPPGDRDEDSLTVVANWQAGLKP